MQNNNPTVHGENSNKTIWSLYNESLVRRMKDILDLKDMEIPGIPRISYRSIFRRIRKIRVPGIMNPSSSVAIDSTGFKTTIRGDWLSNKWAKKRKGWIKLHVSADTEKIMASRISITREHSHDATCTVYLNSGQIVKRIMIWFLPIHLLSFLSYFLPSLRLFPSLSLLP